MNSCHLTVLEVSAREIREREHGVISFFYELPKRLFLLAVFQSFDYSVSCSVTCQALRGT